MNLPGRYAADVGRRHGPAIEPADLARSTFVAVSPKMLLLQQQLGRLSHIDCSVLITGETGTGKEVVARELFRQSTRCDGHFVPLNCGAISETLIESTLFGHRRGAFTGALADLVGLVEEANGGVLLLDEVGDMSPGMQVGLLRFLDSGEFRAVGDPRVRRADVRVISATNCPIEPYIANGRFRADLFYRISAVMLHVPPLRDRQEDFLALVNQHLIRIGQGTLGIARAFSDGAIATLQTYGWPGNVRELQNVVENTVAMSATAIITPDDVMGVLAIRSLMPSVNNAAATSDETVETERFLRDFRGSRTLMAAALGISRTTLWRRQRRIDATTR